MLLKRVKNITKGFDKTAGTDDLRSRLREPSEIALVDEYGRLWPGINDALRDARYVDAMQALASLRQPLDRFFTEVMVMADDRDLRDARLTLLASMRDAILQIADIPEIASESI